MKRGVRWAVGMLLPASLLGLAAAGPGAAQAVPQIVPLVAVAPDDPPGTSIASPACTTPPPVFTYAFFHCYTPHDIHAAYGVDRVHHAGLEGQGQTIVIVDSYGSPTAQQDLNTFSDTFGLPRTTIKIKFPNGAPAYSTTRLKGAEVLWAFETSLDLQWAHAIAPRANLVLVAANPAETEGVQGFPSMFRGEEWAIQHFPGSVMSQSFAASGASFNICAAPYLNYITGPGRTEAVWKEDWDAIATGGGRSVIYPMPAFQSGISPGVLQGRRGLPDLSWNSAVDGGVLVFTSFPGVRAGWHVVGGTSASSPQLAALTALASEKAGKPVGYLNPLLYKLPPSDFTDIVPETFGTGAGVTTLADNSQFGSGIAGMPTTSGWDLTTGFGTPKAMNYITDLAALVDGQ